MYLIVEHLFRVFEVQGSIPDLILKIYLIDGTPLSNIRDISIYIYI